MEKNFKEKFIEGLIPFVFGITGVILSMWWLFLVLEKMSQNIEQDKRPECTQTDLYKLEEMTWGECKDGKQIRSLIKTENFEKNTLLCKNSGKVEAPDLERNCELSLPICTKNDFEFSEWSECSKEGKRKKGILGKKETSQCIIEKLPEAIVENCEYRNTYLISENEKIVKLIEVPLSLEDKNDKVIFNQLSTYPKIKINSSNIKNAYIKVKIDFNEYFKQYYKGKIDWYNATTKQPARYIFALKYFIGDIENWGYIDVIMQDSGMVDLWLDGGFLWAYSGKDILGGKEFIINLESVNVAVSKDEVRNDYRYKTLKPLDFIKKSEGKTLPIGVFLSDAKGTLIKSMEIIYDGDKNAIELLK